MVHTGTSLHRLWHLIVYIRARHYMGCDIRLCTYGHVITWAVTYDCVHTGTSLHGRYGSKCCYYSTCPSLLSRVGSGLLGGTSSFKPGWLWGSNLDNDRGFVCIDVDGWAVFNVGFDEVIPVSMVCGTGLLGLWGVGFGVEVLVTALGMGNWIVGVSSFLRNRPFRKVILPGLSTLTRYWWLRRVLITWPVVSHRRIVGHWIATICLFWREHRSCTVLLYRSMRRYFGLRLSNSRVACRARGWDGTKSRCRWWSSNWAWRMALAVYSLSNDPPWAVLPLIILLADSTASTDRPLDCMEGTDNSLCLTALSCKKLFEWKGCKGLPTIAAEFFWAP